jgi:hypothetical protein
MTHISHFPVAGARRCFVVAQNPRGQWVARDRRGMIEGVFRTQREAVRFALFETGDPGSVSVISGGEAAARSGS